MLCLDRTIRRQPSNTVTAQFINKEVLSAEERFAETLGLCLLGDLAGACEEGILADGPGSACRLKARRSVNVFVV